MTLRTVGVFSDRGLAADLREPCRDWTLATSGEERDACRLVIIDTDSHELLASPPRKSLVRVVLCEGELPLRRPAELCLARANFLQQPDAVLSFAADLAEAAIHASQLEQEVSYLTQVQELMSMIEADEVSERITRTVLNLIGVGRGTLFLHDPRLERYVVSFSNDPSYRETDEFLPGIPSDLLQAALASGRYYALRRNSDGTGLIVLPLQAGDDLIGVIRVPLVVGEEADSDAQAGVTRYLSAVTHVLSNVYQLTRSRDLAMRDDLTKAYNRRFFETYLDEEIERARRYGALFSIIFLDLDDLKMVNSYYGHLAGSRVLQEVAKRILSAVRGIDKVVRFGGDEFCIILPQTDQDQAVAVANRVRKALSASALHIDAAIETSITASFGIASYPTHGVTKDGLIRQADAAMYRVKSTTKNAVGLATLEDATRPISPVT